MIQFPGVIIHGEPMILLPPIYRDDLDHIFCRDDDNEWWACNNCFQKYVSSVMRVMNNLSDSQIGFELQQETF